MATEDNAPSEHLVHHTLGSRFDLVSIYQYNEATYGEEHAERYLDFLDVQIAELALHPEMGQIVEQHPKIRVHIAKVSRRRNSSGHRIFYREVADGIEVIRVLHTSMNWPEHFD